MTDINQFTKGRAVDVLIVGAGPTGYMAASTLARYGVAFRIVDKRPTRVDRGHASGLQPRILEIMHTLGMRSDFAKHGKPLTEVSFWYRKGSTLERFKDSPEPEIIDATHTRTWS